MKGKKGGENRKHCEYNSQALVKRNFGLSNPQTQSKFGDGENRKHCEYNSQALVKRNFGFSVPFPNRKGQEAVEFNKMAAIIILLLFAALVAGVVIILKSKGIGAMDFVQRIFRFGR